MEPIKLEKSKVEKEPYLIWNSFIQIIADEPDKLNDIQGVAHFAFWYESEVQNGGHLQYFQNMSITYSGKEDIVISATLEALKIIGAKEQLKILSSASKRYFLKKRTHPETVDEFVELELGDEFGKFDRQYYNCDHDMNSHLEKYLQKHTNEFVIFV
jgi:hypothetical protein